MDKKDKKISSVVLHRLAGVKVLTALVLSGALSACSMAPKYEQPVAPIPGAWNEIAPDYSADQKSVASQMDWKVFVVDDTLRTVIDSALTNNRDLAQALLNIEIARAQHRIQRADRLPGLNAQVDGARQRLPADLSATGSSGVQSVYQAGLALTAFELDLFGRVQNLSQASLQEYLAIEANAKSTKISLIAEVIQAYLMRESAQQRKLLAQQTLESRIQSFELTSKRRASGSASALDYQEAKGLTEQAQADYERIDRELRQANNALQVLVGDHRVLASLPERTTGFSLVQNLAPGVPSELLINRPDILAAEHQLQASNANIGAARAAFFPRISLTAMLGSSSSELSNLFEGGQRMWSFSPQLSLPIFQGGRNQSNLDIALIRKDVAVAAYEKSIQVAFREVSDALAETDTLSREEISRQSLADSSMEAQRLSEARYRGGVDSHLRYLESQRNAYGNQMALIETSAQRQIALANLFKALGGGWIAGNEEKELKLAQ